MTKVWQEVIEWAKAFVLAIVIVGVISIFVAPTTVFSVSMNPTLVEKDVLLLRKTQNVKKGDIVSFKTNMLIEESDRAKMTFIQKLTTPEGARKNLIKRVVAEPGDSLEIKDGKVTINGVVSKEDYAVKPTDGDVKIDKIPENMYFMMGDNRPQSLDSRYEEVGLVKKEDIIGSSMVRVWPLNKLGVVK